MLGASDFSIFNDETFELACALGTSVNASYHCTQKSLVRRTAFLQRNTTTLHFCPFPLRLCPSPGRTSSAFASRPQLCCRRRLERASASLTNRMSSTLGKIEESASRSAAVSRNGGAVVFMSDPDVDIEKGEANMLSGRGWLVCSC